MYKRQLQNVRMFSQCDIRIISKCQFIRLSSTAELDLSAASIKEMHRIKVCIVELQELISTRRTIYTFKFVFPYTFMEEIFCELNIQMNDVYKRQFFSLSILLSS